MSPEHRPTVTVVPSYSRAPESFSSRGHHTAGSVADLTDLIDLTGRLHPRREISRYEGTSWRENCSASRNVTSQHISRSRAKKYLLFKGVFVSLHNGNKLKSESTVSKDPSLDQGTTTFILKQIQRSANSLGETRRHHRVAAGLECWPLPYHGKL